MHNKISTYTPLAWLLVIPIINIFYGILNHSGGHAAYLLTKTDTIIPFIPLFVIPYLIWYPFTFIVYFLLFKHDRSMYYRAFLISCTGLIVCYITFYFFQTMIIRPVVEDGDIFIKLVKLVYATDAPYNCFPSIHVLTSYILMKATYFSKVNEGVKKACM